VCWIPILKGKKLILAGDPMQLPPTVLSVDKKNKKSAGLGTQSKTSTAKPSQKDKKDKSAAVPEENSAVDVDSSDSERSSSSEGETEQSTDKQKSPRNDAPQKKDKPVRPKNHAPVLRPPRTLETTLFDRLEKMYGSTIKRMLQVQYRLVFRIEHRDPHVLIPGQNAFRYMRLSVQNLVLVEAHVLPFRRISSSPGLTWDARRFRG
jgi:DNA polymerase alpha-associated DNA helicase A